MTACYCAKDKKEEAEKHLTEPYIFISPTIDTIDHTATHVVIVGPHKHIAERYKGIANVEFLELDTDEPNTGRE